ncbi:MAG: hypothetical protein REI11_13235, partial [Patulibacter sp.]|nr:hypothetical protein [Patulibacter sp.]
VQAGRGYSFSVAVDDLPNQATGLPIYGTSNIKILSMDMTLWGRVGQTLTPGFYFNPAECITATTNAAIVAYDGSTSNASNSYTPTNCAGAPFSPTVSFTPNPSAASTPTAFTIDVGQPYNPTAAKIGGPIKKTVLVLPQGVQLTGATNSDGNLVGCSDAQFGYSSSAPDTCPAGSKVGTVIMDSPLVGQVPGNVYLSPPVAGSGNLIRLFVVAQQSSAVDALRIKLLTTVDVDPTTGILTNTLDNLPAQPVTDFKFQFRAGTAPGTRQPRTCGTYPGSAALTGYSTATPVVSNANYVVGTNCPAAGSFHPTIAMTDSPQTAGAATTGTTTIDLPIGDEPLTHVKVSLPPGLLANIAGITRCTASQVSADSCPAASQVGTVKSLAGQSSVPGQFSGAVYLTDAPTSGSLVGIYVRVPVVVGPIVVDTLKIQGAINLRPDYGIDVVSDIPDQVRGLQLDQQELQLVFDKSGFLVNPPVCSGNTISGDFSSKQGTAKTASSTVSWPAAVVWLRPQ